MNKIKQVREPPRLAFSFLALRGPNVIPGLASPSTHFQVGNLRPVSCTDANSYPGDFVNRPSRTRTSRSSARRLRRTRETASTTLPSSASRRRSPSSVKSESPRQLYGIILMEGRVLAEGTGN